MPVAVPTRSAVARSSAQEPRPSAARHQRRQRQDRGRALVSDASVYEARRRQVAVAPPQEGRRRRHQPSRDGRSAAEVATAELVADGCAQNARMPASPGAWVDRLAGHVREPVRWHEPETVHRSLGAHRRGRRSAAIARGERRWRRRRRAGDRGRAARHREATAPAPRPSPTTACSAHSIRWASHEGAGTASRPHRHGDAIGHDRVDVDRVARRSPRRGCGAGRSPPRRDGRA